MKREVNHRWSEKTRMMVNLENNKRRISLSTAAKVGMLKSMVAPTVLYGIKCFGKKNGNI